MIRANTIFAALLNKSELPLAAQGELFSVVAHAAYPLEHVKDGKLPVTKLQENSSHRTVSETRRLKN